MFTIILYTALCFSANDCHEYETASWTAITEADVNQALDTCAKEERKYIANVIGSYKESDCYVVEGK